MHLDISDQFDQVIFNEIRSFSCDKSAASQSSNPHLKTHILLAENVKRKDDTGWKYKEMEIREPPCHFCADLKRSCALCKHLVHQLDPMHQRAQGHTGTGWRLPLTATVNFQHNQFMCSSIITICVPQEEDSPEEQNSAGCFSSPWATPGARGRRRKWRRRKKRSWGDEWRRERRRMQGWRRGGQEKWWSMGIKTKFRNWGGWRRSRKSKREKK